MSYGINYGGDDRFMMDAALAAMVEDRTGGSDWYVEVTKTDGETVEGWATKFQRGPRRLTIAEARQEDGALVPTGRVVDIYTEDIAELEIP